MIRWIAALGAAAACFCLNTQAASVWIADKHNLYRLDAGTNQVAQTIVRADTEKLAGTKDGALWLLGNRRLVRFATDGTPLLDLDLKALSLNGAEHLAVDTDRVSLWLGEAKADDENDADDGNGRTKRIVRVDGTGKRVAEFIAPGRIRAMSLGLDGSLWLLGNKTLWQYSPTGTQRSAIDLKAVAKEGPALLAVDSLGVWLWLAADRQLMRLDGDAPAPALKILLDRKIEALAADLKSGTLWVASDQSLIAYRSDGTLKQSIDLTALGLTRPGSLVVDGANGALWLGHDKGVTRFSLNGTRITTTALKDDAQAIGISPFTLTPTISVLTPAEGALLSQPTPELRLAYGADCDGNPCGFNPEYYQTYRLFTTLNGQESGDQFVYSPLGGEAVLVPAQRLPEGINTLIARATDSFGQQSATVERRFTVDTTPPRISVVSPVDGTSVSTSQIAIIGSVDEPATVHLSGGGLAMDASGQSFNFPVALKPGENIFTLSATDCAGNQTTQTLRYSLAAGVQLTITSPRSGSTATGNSAVVMGTFQGPPNIGITANGTLAAIVGNRFLATVNLSPGGNAISVVASTQEGFSTSQVVTITAGQASAVDLHIEPAVGIAPHSVSIAVPTLPGRSMVRLDVDFDGDGVVDDQSAGSPLTFTYRMPGIYMATVRLDDFEGGIYTATIPVVVRSVKELDTALQKTISDMRGRMQAGDVEGALQFFVPAVREHYRAFFESLGSTLPTVSSQLGVVADGSITEGFAEYVLERDKPTGKQAYLLYLVPGDDGIWRISQM